jgi:hypothetical protein
MADADAEAPTEEAGFPPDMEVEQPAKADDVEIPKVADDAEESEESAKLDESGSD